MIHSMFTSEFPSLVFISEPTVILVVRKLATNALELLGVVNGKSLLCDK